MPTITIPSEIAERTKEFVDCAGAVEQVCDWLSKRTDHVFLLTSASGSGKTAVAAYLPCARSVPKDIHIADQLERIRWAWNAGHFFIGKTNGDSINPRRFASALAEQLSNRFPGYATTPVRAIDHIAAIAQQPIEITEWRRVLNDGGQLLQGDQGNANE